VSLSSEQRLSDSFSWPGEVHTRLVDRVSRKRTVARGQALLARDTTEYEHRLAEHEHERDLGPDDPATLARRDQVGGLYLSARSPSGVTVLEQNLRDAERVLGPDHPMPSPTGATWARPMRRPTSPRPSGCSDLTIQAPWIGAGR
jgi:hypothetical protein